MLCSKVVKSLSAKFEDSKRPKGSIVARFADWPASNGYISRGGHSRPWAEVPKSLPWHPQAGYWQQYAETELAAGNTDAVKSIFGRCLLHNLHVDLWRLYLRFIKQVGAW